jgi:enterochelin esterase-like enzyme
MPSDIINSNPMTHRLLLLATVLALGSAQAADRPKLTPYHEVQPGVPTGALTKFTNFTSKIFTNTVRDWWIYVPAQYKAGPPANVMVFQDGHDYVNLRGNWRVPTVFDNLIHKGELPVTIGIFINPGHDASRPAPTNAWRASNRSVEYDSLGDRYARFLVEEILPEVKKKYTLTDDPEGRAICGASSGGICSFTVAWERPDQFRKVLSTIGSFVDLRGGHAYPYLIRKTEKKPIRVYLQDGKNDLDNPFGNWPLANQMMNASLKYMKYDVRFDFTEGEHNSNDAGPLLPDALKWLWRR